MTGHQQHAAGTLPSESWEEMLKEAGDWTFGRVERTVLEALLKKLTIKTVDTRILEENMNGRSNKHYTRFKLQVEASLPAGQDGGEYDLTMAMDFVDEYNNATLRGSLRCEPFFKPVPATGDGLKRSRGSWNVQIPESKLKSAAEGWIKGAELKPDQVSWQDAARAIAAAIGVAAADHDGHTASRPLVALMKMLQRQLRAMDDPAYDPLEMDPLEKVRKFGGILTSNAVMDQLRSEARWDPKSKRIQRAARENAAPPNKSQRVA